MAAQSLSSVCASGAVWRSGLCASSWRASGRIPLYGESNRSLDRRPITHSVCRVYSRRADLRRDLRVARLQEAGSSLRSPGERGDQGDGHPLQHDGPHWRFVHLRPAGNLPAIHDLADQSLFPRLRRRVSAAVHQRDDPSLHVFLYLGCLEGEQEGPAHRTGRVAESDRDDHAVRDRRSDLLHEYAGEGGRYFAAGIPGDRHALGQDF